MSLSFIKQFFATPTRKLIAMIALALIFGLLLVALLGNRNQMVPLYSELSKEDCNSILYKLAKDRVKYSLSSDGKAIMVPESLVYQLRAALAMEGIPAGASSIVGYEIFDKEEQIGSTSFSQNIKNIRAKQGELSRTIQAFDNIVKARVHLAIPHKELFSREKQTPTASVMLTLKPGVSLRVSDIRAISHLVARSVEGLKEKEVTIVDTSGNVLQAGGEEEFGLTGLHSVEHCSALERHLKNKIETLVARIVGAGNVDVRASIEMSFDKIVTNSEVYDPDKSALRSNQSKEEIELSPFSGNLDGGDVSVSSNLADSQSSEESNERSKAERREDVSNYEVSRTVENKVSDVGQIKQISVSVLVNDNFDSATGTFIPRSESGMSKIETLVKGAMGYQELRDDKLFVVHMPFFKEAEPSAQGFEKTWLQQNTLPIVRAVCASAVALLAIFYILRPLVYSYILKGSASNALFAQSVKGTAPSISGLGGTLQKLLEGNREKFVGTLRRWMKKD